MTVKDKMKVLAAQVDMLSISRAEIARRYGCSRQYVYMALAGQRRAPHALRDLIAGMIAERQAAMRRFLRKRKAS